MKMGYWIRLVDDKEESLSLEAPHVEGGTIDLEGNNFTEISITYNYSRFFSFKELDGMKALDSIIILEEKVDKFGTNRDKDYWEPSEGNVGHACNVLLQWARLYPNGTWKIE